MLAGEALNTLYAIGGLLIVGLAGVGVCYAIAWVVAAHVGDDAGQIVGDVIEVPREEKRRTTKLVGEGTVKAARRSTDHVRTHGGASK